MTELTCVRVNSSKMYTWCNVKGNNNNSSSSSGSIDDYNLIKSHHSVFFICNKRLVGHYYVCQSFTNKKCQSKNKQIFYTSCTSAYV